MSSTQTGDRLLHGLGYARVASKWGWFVALGAVLVVAGVLALGDVVAFTLVSVIFIGAMLIVGGISQIIHALMTKTWGGFTLNTVMGVLSVVAGLVIMGEPVQGSVILTLFLLAAILVGGVMRMIVAVRHRELQGWWLILLGGIVSVIVSLMLYATLPWSGLWILGTLIAIELLIQGFTWLRFGLSLRRMARMA